jgi:hypothetical protein
MRIMRCSQEQNDLLVVLFGSELFLAALSAKMMHIHGSDIP